MDKKDRKKILEKSGGVCKLPRLSINTINKIAKHRKKFSCVKHIPLTAQQLEFIEKLAEARFEGNFSQALRFIINEAIEGKGIIWEGKHG